MFHVLEPFLAAVQFIANKKVNFFGHSQIMICQVIDDVLLHYSIFLLRCNFYSRNIENSRMQQIIHDVVEVFLRVAC